MVFSGELLFEDGGVSSVRWCALVCDGLRWCTVVYGGELLFEDGGVSSVRWCALVCDGLRWCTVVYGGVRCQVVGRTEYRAYLVPIPCLLPFLSHTPPLYQMVKQLSYPCFHKTDTQGFPALVP